MNLPYFLCQKSDICSKYINTPIKGHDIFDIHQKSYLILQNSRVQKATSAITDNFSSSNSKLLNAKDSLERIKAKQQKFDDQMKAAEVLDSENSDNSLAAQLKEAGIGGTDNSANSVLERLKAKQK